jgi:hypothetical protein
MNNEDKKTLDYFEKAQMAGASDNQLDFYGIQKGEEAEDKAEEAEESGSSDFEKMMSEGLAKMMEDEDSDLSKMMYKMMRKMVDEEKPDEDDKDQMSLPGMSKAIEVESVAAPVNTTARGRDALVGWLNN